MKTIYAAIIIAAAILAAAILNGGIYEPVKIGQIPAALNKFTGKIEPITPAK